MGLSKFQAGKLSQLVIVLLRWGRISMMGPPGCVVISASHHLSLSVSHLSITGMYSLPLSLAFSLQPSASSCTLGVLLVLLFCSCACSPFLPPSYLHVCPSVLLSLLISSWVLYIPCRSTLIFLKLNRHRNPIWAPSGWGENVGKFVRILSWLNSIKCSDGACSLRACLQTASECPYCSVTSWLIWSSVLLKKEGGCLWEPQVCPQNFGKEVWKSNERVYFHFQNYMYSIHSILPTTGLSVSIEKH